MLKNYEEVVSLVKNLGQELLPQAGKIEDIGIKKKWLTQYDIDIEKKITTLVQSFEGEHNVFGEELHEDFLEADNVWIVDPISHTFNFLHGLPHFAVVVSHMYKGELRFAAVYDPFLDEMFTAFRGKGAFLNGVKINVKDQEESRCVLFDHGMQGLDDFLTAQERIFSLGRIKTFGSLGLHYAYVACGRAQLAVSLNKDVFPEFAGKLIVEEAGGVFLDFEGKDLGIFTRGIIAASSKDLFENVRTKLNGFGF